MRGPNLTLDRFNELMAALNGLEDVDQDVVDAVFTLLGAGWEIIPPHPAEPAE
jgi:hypothetical protein